MQVTSKMNISKMNIVNIVLVVICMNITHAHAYTIEALNDQIIALPRATPLLSKQFSGFLDITETKNLHYMYYESERSPDSDSVVFWTNGGPGCSGLLGLFTEFGPWRPVANGSLVSNPFSWTKLASLVFLEQPVGVGFSYGTEDTELLSYNDYRAAGDNILAIRSFFKRFPERASQPFYIASESYGGHYIPQWTLQLLEDEALRGRFKGMMVGNPFTSYASGSVAMANAMWGQQMLPRPAWEEFVAAGCADLSTSPYALIAEAPHCFEMTDVIFGLAGAINPYALSFPTCSSSSGRKMTNTDARKRRTMATAAEGSDDSSNASWRRGLSQQAKSLLRIHERIKGSSEYQESIERHRRAQLVEVDDVKGTLSEAASTVAGASAEISVRAPKSSFFADYKKLGAFAHERPMPATRRTLSASEDDIISSSLPYDACTADYTADYLNDPLVQEALHVLRPVDPLRGDETLSSRSSVWAECDDYVNGMWAFNDYLADTTALYGVVFAHEHKPRDFKMLVFSGDADGVCSTVGTQHWVYDIPGAEVLSLYRPWHYNNSLYGTRQQAGYLTQFSDSLSFATVHNAGHEVPAYQPEIAMELFARYLDGSLFVASVPSESSSSGEKTDSGVFPDLASEVVGVLLITMGIVGVILGALWYFRTQSRLREGALADQNSGDEI